jgi:GntR family transcriptional regulator/MocR family aminotransferase
MNTTGQVDIGLLLDLESRSGPRHQRVAVAVRDAIRAGRLAPGERLPASRALAADLGVSRWVVVEAYEQLTAEGYLEARRGAGTTVARAAAAQAGPRDGLPSVPPGGTQPLLDLRPGHPDLSAFPRSAWQRAYVAAARSATTDELGYPPTAGMPALRRTIAHYLRRVRGISASPDEVAITLGTAAGMRLLARALVARGASELLVEEPGWQVLPAVARDCGLRIMPWAVDQEGLVVEGLPRAGAALVTPAHQFPSGAAMSPDRRRGLLAWAAAQGALVIEDDYDAEFRYDRRPVGALAGLDRRHVAYLGSVSKTLAPGIRLGWLVVPPELRPALDELLPLHALPSALDQLALARLVESGGYDRHLRTMRHRYRERRDALVAALHGESPGTVVGGIAAGLHLSLPLGDPGRAQEVAASLARAGVLVAGPERYSSTSTGAIVLSYARLPVERAPEAARLIARALR